MKKKKDKIYNVSIYKRLVLMSLHVLLQTIPASVVCAREGGEKGLWRTRTRAKHGARLERMTAGQNLTTLSCKNAIDANFSFSVSL